MTQNWGRGVGVLAVLAAVWVFVYWWWEPRHPRISFDESRATRDAASEGQPGPVPVEKPAPVQPLRAPAPTATTGSSSTPKPPPRTETVAPPIAVVPPSFRVYTVRKGDTWESIATKEMGSSRLWGELTRANPLMTDLKEGREIRIPLDPSNIQGRPVTEAPAPVGTDSDKEYTVKSGDTLGGIAKAYYGSTSYKDLIYQANRDRLKDEDRLKVGDKLRLPPPPKPN